jgi:glycosyltransferase involved in cell wall biosynthesis
MDFVFLSTALWDSDLWTNKQHLASRLAAKGHRVLFVESLNLRRPALTLSDFGRAVRRLRRTIRPARVGVPGLTIISPAAYTGSRARIVRDLSLSNVWRAVEREMAVLNFSAPILWLYNPVCIQLARDHLWHRVIYHCVDDLAAIPGIDAHLIAASEAVIAQRADHVICSSRPLFDLWTRRTSRAVYYPNVADVDLFASAKPDEEVTQLRRVGTERLVLLYYGAISSYKVDFQLLAELARRRPEWGIWLIGILGEGQSLSDSGVLRGARNIHIRPPVDPRKLARIVAAADVCLLPHRINEYTEASFPMKFFECLAAGKPIVGRQLASLREFWDLYEVADDVDEFITAIERTTRNDTPAQITRRKTVAAGYSWDARIREIERLMLVS